jgi:hypothetical protein
LSGFWLNGVALPSFKIILKVFMKRSIAELEQLQDAKFELTNGGQGTLISSTVNGSQFTFGVATALSAMDIVQYAQTALEYKEAGICAPVTRTTARFV